MIRIVIHDTGQRVPCAYDILSDNPREAEEIQSMLEDYKLEFTTICNTLSKHFKNYKFRLVAALALKRENDEDKELIKSFLFDILKTKTVDAIIIISNNAERLCECCEILRELKSQFSHLILQKPYKVITTV